MERKFYRELSMKSKKIKDLEKVEKREKTFSTLAKKEGRGALKREKSEKRAGLKESAKDSAWETRIDKKFSDIRKKKALEIEKMIKKSK